MSKLKDYIYVKEAVSAEVADFAGKAVLIDLMTGQMDIDNDQVIGAKVKYRHSACEAMMLKVWKVAEEQTGLELCPTYSFIRHYTKGMDLKRHSDRPSCEISATVCLTYDSDYLWPICAEGVDGTNASVELDKGDLMIYRGCDIEHWRDPLEGNWWLQAFVHFIDKNGPYYPEFKHDKKELPSIYNNIDFMDI